MEIESRVARFITEKFRLSGDVLDSGRSLFEAGVLDSVGIFDLVEFLEKEFGLSIGDEQIVPENFESVRAITALVEKLREAS